MGSIFLTKPTKKQKILKRLRMAAVGLLILTLSALVVYFIATKTKLDGEFTAPGLSAAVTIKFDDNAIPHIQAQTNEDALFALGYLHASERPWQMEFNRRLASGKLSEILGPNTLGIDKFIRTLGIRRAAEKQFENYPIESKRMIQAYSDGVNEAYKRLGWALPAEFMILGTEPGIWSPADTVAWSLMMALDMGGNWHKEFLRLELSQTIDTARIWEVLPPYPGEAPPTSANFAQMYRDLGVFKAPQNTNKVAAHQELLKDLPGGFEGVGSNNWVVSGQKSATDKPWLANDPHLGLTSPAVWYFAHIDAPDIKVIGATLPGLPMVVLGRTPQIAWGFTNTDPDVQDLYLEAIDQQNTSRYQLPGGGHENFIFREEIVAIKGQAAERFIVRESRHGPIISDAYDRAKDLINTDRFALAMRWTALDTGNQTLVAGLGMNRATNLEDFKSALKHYYAPMQNIVMADVDGNIAYRAIGAVPKRTKGHGLFGSAPAPGWDKQYDWAGYLPLDVLPKENNPTKGWVATANHRVHSANDPHPLTADWHMPYRFDRIESMLQATEKHTLNSMKEIQTDTLSLSAKELLPHLQAAQSNHPLAAEAKTILANYDGHMNQDSSAATIFNAWADQLARRLFEKKLGKSFAIEYGKRDFRAGVHKVVNMYANGQSGTDYWCDKAETPEIENCDQAFGESLTKALDMLSDRLGKKPSAWRWGDVHVAVSEHRPFSKVSLLKNRFEVKRPTPGDSFSINVGFMDLGNTSNPFVVTKAASMRAIYDLSDMDKSQFIYQTGQSGWINSHNYDNFADTWSKQGYLMLTMAPNTITHTATLKPPPGTKPPENKKPENRAPERKKK